MKIAILGTGSVGQTLAQKLSEVGHDVVIGTRDPAATLARTEPTPMSKHTYAEWSASHPKVGLATFAEAAKGSELIINASSGFAAHDVLSTAGAENVKGKIVWDLSNPLDFSNGFPPSLFTSAAGDSLGERLQAAFPDARIVKTLNTVSAPVMVAPASVAGGQHTMFVCGNDADAKQKTKSYLSEWFGWTDVLDLGGIEQARGTEGYLLLWTRLYGAIQSPMFSIKVAR
ncbi:MAG: NADPH-dependent F420 reductase [Sandaracinaceae bacterium]